MTTSSFSIPTRALLFISCMLLTATMSVEAQGIRMSGQMRMGTSGSKCAMSVELINNDGQPRSRSGGLVLQLWACDNPPSGGIKGYLLAQKYIGTLPGRYQFTNVSVTAPYKQPPDGTYYMVLALAEWSGSEYLVVDHTTFDGQETFGSPSRINAGSIPTPSAVIESKVDGEFEGWDGETIVKLMNGQIWQQARYHYEYHYAYMPDVLIYKSGSRWKMKVEGTDEAVEVERLK